MASKKHALFNCKTMPSSKKEKGFKHQLPRLAPTKQEQPSLPAYGLPPN